MPQQSQILQGKYTRGCCALRSWLDFGKQGRLCRCGTSLTHIHKHLAAASAPGSHGAAAAKINPPQRSWLRGLRPSFCPCPQKKPSEGKGRGDFGQLKSPP